MTTCPFNLAVVHPTWKTCLEKSLACMDPAYLTHLANTTDWLPGPDKIFSAFSLPIDQVNYVLFGESPYPRQESANGYAFWDAAVTDIWSDNGLSKKVNRATSLRNMIKMMLVAEGWLDKHNTSQDHIAQLNKAPCVKTNEDFFRNFLQHGFLLLNATPVLQLTGSPDKDARAWIPFNQSILAYLLEKQPQVQFVFLGRIANKIEPLLANYPVDKVFLEHPYNHSFITNPTAISFFRPLHLLLK